MNFINIRASSDDSYSSLKSNPIWMTNSANCIISNLMKLGPGEENAEDKDDVEAWLCLSLAVRVVLPLTNSQTCFSARLQRDPARFAIQFSLLILQRGLDNVDDGGIPSWWDRALASVLSKWKVPSEITKKDRWHGVAASILALERLSTDSNNILKNSPKCLAFVDVATSCLQASLILFQLSNLFENDNDDDEYRHLDEENEKPEATAEISALFAALETLESLSNLVASLTRRDAMNNSHLRRVNYQLNCMRQYCSIKKAWFRLQSPNTVLQGTLDSWVSVHSIASSDRQTTT